MKKVLALVLSLFVLAGCSLFADYYNAEELANEMNQLVLQENKNTKDYLTKMDEKYFEYLQSDGADLTHIKKLLSELKTLAGPYKEKVKQVEAKFPDLKAKTAKLEDPEIKKLAETFLADFAKTTKTELEITDLYLEYVKLQEEVIKQVESGQQPSQELFNKDQELTKKMDDINQRYQNEIKAFNNSWKVFNEKATGTKVKDQ